MFQMGKSLKGFVSIVVDVALLPAACQLIKYFHQFIYRLLICREATFVVVGHNQHKGFEELINYSELAFISSKFSVNFTLITSNKPSSLD